MLVLENITINWATLILRVLRYNNSFLLKNFNSVNNSKTKK